MKVKLTEETLNAYITEAIRQELNEVNEGIFRFLRSGKKPGLIKRAVKRYKKNLTGNKEGLDKLQKEYDDIVRKQAQSTSTQGASKILGPDGVPAKSAAENFETDLACNPQRTKILKQMQALRRASTATRVGTGVAGGAIAGHALGKKNRVNPNADGKLK